MASDEERREVAAALRTGDRVRVMLERVGR